jgi:hypothetical protein
VSSPPHPASLFLICRCVTMTVALFVIKKTMLLILVYANPAARTSRFNYPMLKSMARHVRVYLVFVFCVRDDTVNYNYWYKSSNTIRFTKRCTVGSAAKVTIVKQIKCHGTPRRPACDSGLCLLRHEEPYTTYYHRGPYYLETSPSTIAKKSMYDFIVSVWSKTRCCECKK